MKNRKLAFFMAATFTAAGIVQSGLPVCAEEAVAEEVIFEENGIVLEMYDDEAEICANMDIPEIGEESGSDHGDVKEAEAYVSDPGERAFDTDIVVEMVEETAVSDLELQAGEDVVINETNFPDDAFRQKVSEICDTGEKDGILTEAERKSVTILDVEGEAIESLKGIEFFESLEILNCGDNALTSLDVSGNTKLTSLDCYNNLLSSLDVSGNTELVKLDCFGNILTSLDVSDNTKLMFLYCSNNLLPALDISGNTVLNDLDCSGNQLTSLSTSQNKDLDSLNCGDNQLTSLDVSGSTKLTQLTCLWNQLDSLDVSQNSYLTHLYCGNNRLTGLDLSCNSLLEDLECAENQLTSLDLSCNSLLEGLECAGNQLRSLDLSQNSLLQGIACSKNQLTSLVFSEDTNLLDIWCSDNHLSVLDLSRMKQIKSIAANAQTITVSAVPAGGSWKANMAEVVGAANVGRIRKADLTLYGGADWDGMIDLGSGEHPNTNAFTYYYETQASNPYYDLPQSTKYMEVQVTVQEVPHTHRWTEWGTVSPASLIAPEQQQRSCPDCGSVETRSVGEKLQPQSQIQMNCGTSVLPITLKHSIKLTAFGLSEGDTVVSWRSSNTKVAAVSKNGKVTAKKTGTATITVTTKTGATASVTVKVQKKAVATKKIRITTGKTASVKQGKTKAIKTKITPITSLDKVKFSSSDKKVVSVNSRGVIKGVKKGKATITAKSGKKKAKIQVTVK